MQSGQLRARSSLLATASCCWFLTAGCIPSLPDNVDVPPPPRTFLSETGGARFFAEAGVDDASWVEIPASTGGVPVGGYLSHVPADSHDLVILLHGASTFEPDGGLGAAREFHVIYGVPFRDAGFRTLALDFRECGTGYGIGDTADLITAIDWLQGDGRDVLGIDRVYTVGYSVGATAAIIANRQRRIAAVASISGVTEPEQFLQVWPFYYVASGLYPNNTGLCQIGSTLQDYSLPWSPAWDALDTVRHIDELLSPMLVIQGLEDQIFPISNAEDLEAAYRQALAAGAALPMLEFLYLPGDDHFAPPTDPGAIQAIIDFFNRTQSTAGI